jgi:hypothetical protein
MRARARARIDEILKSEPRRILPSEIEGRIKAIADNVVAEQGG